MPLFDTLLSSAALRKLEAGMMMEHFHNTNLLIHMPPDAICKKHVLPAINGFFCPVDGDIVNRESLPQHREHL